MDQIVRITRGKLHPVTWSAYEQVYKATIVAKSPPIEGLGGRWRRTRWIAAPGSRPSWADNDTFSIRATMVLRVGRVLMARGRDAADTALTTTFGVHHLASFTVWTNEISEAGLRQSRSSPQDSVISG